LHAIYILTDNNGHPGWELAERLGMKKNNLSRDVIKPLEYLDVIYHEQRPTTSGSSHPNKKEHAYFINKSPNSLLRIIYSIEKQQTEIDQIGVRINTSVEKTTPDHWFTMSPAEMDNLPYEEQRKFDYMANSDLIQAALFYQVKHMQETVYKYFCNMYREARLQGNGAREGLP
jgi:hypothetical protein